MLGSAILDTAIGIVFIYLFFSLINSVITEWIASLMKLRAQTLEEGIRKLLNDPKGDGLTTDFYAHPLIKGIKKDDRKPSYISSRTFALTLLDLIAPAESRQVPLKSDELRKKVADWSGGAELKKTLSILLDEAGQDTSKALENIEKWFDEGMARVSGWYKRKSQWMIFLFAVGVTLIFNVDTINIASTLYRDSTLRSGLIAAAEESVKQPLAGTQEEKDKAIDLLNKQLSALKLPLGWADGENKSLTSGKDISDNGPILWWITKILGWLLTAFAVTLGAPFWFDVLNKFINIRGTGKQPAVKEASSAASTQGPVRQGGGD